MKSLWIVCAVLSLSSPQFRQRDSADRILRSMPCRPTLQWGMDHVKDVEAKVRIGQIDHTIRTTQAEKDFLAIAPKKWPWIDYLPFFQDENNQPCYERYQPWLLWAREEKPESEGQVAERNHMKERVVVWFSCGAASAVATKLILAEYPKANIVIAYCYVANEHSDNLRFLKDCEKWFDHPITMLQSDKYKDIYDVFEKQNYLVSPYGAPCTLHLKKRVRQRFEEPSDLQVFGYTMEETERAERFRQHNPDVRLLTPLIESGLTKADCLGMLQRAKIELPAMYHLGYQNNNCIGCVKGGMGYWNKIRKDFPEVFHRMATLERQLENTVLRDNGEPLYLDTFDPERGNYPSEPNIECSLMCHFAEETLANHQQAKDV